VFASFLVSACALARAPAPDVFDLEPATQFGESLGSSSAQLAVTEPTVVGALDTDRIAVRLSSTQVSYLGRSEWNARIAHLVQRRLIESFQNTDRVRSVGLPGGAVVNDVGLVTDLRAFHINVPENRAEVEIVARLVSDRTGRVIATRTFRSAAALYGDDRAQMVAALNAAFVRSAGEIVVWTLERI
jgi:cholesterol transport system auxiliary component